MDAGKSSAAASVPLHLRTFRTSLSSQRLLDSDHEKQQVQLSGDHGPSESGLDWGMAAGYCKVECLVVGES